jgi:hypothetical protein
MGHQGLLQDRAVRRILGTLDLVCCPEPLFAHLQKGPAGMWPLRSFPALMTNVFPKQREVTQGKQEPRGTKQDPIQDPNPCCSLPLQLAEKCFKEGKCSLQLMVLTSELMVTLRLWFSARGGGLFKAIRLFSLHSQLSPPFVP